MNMSPLESRAYNAGVNEGLNRAVIAMQRALNINLKGIIQSEIERHPNTGTIQPTTEAKTSTSKELAETTSVLGGQVYNMRPHPSYEELPAASSTEVGTGGSEPIRIAADELRRVHRSTAAGKLKRAELRRDWAIEAATVEMSEIGHCDEVKGKALVLLDCLEAHDPRAARAAAEEFLKG